MAKWRDVKQNKVTPKVEQTLSKEEGKISSSSLGKRVKAFLTDSFLITTPIIYIVMYLILGGGTDFADNRVFGWGLILGISAFIIVFFWYVKSQTPGMKAYQVKIVTNSKTKVTLIQTIVRYIATLFAIISFFLLFIPFFNKDRKSFQDLISNTIIIDD